MDLAISIPRIGIKYKKNMQTCPAVDNNVHFICNSDV